VPVFLYGGINGRENKNLAVNSEGMYFSWSPRKVPKEGDSRGAESRATARQRRPLENLPSRTNWMQTVVLGKNAGSRGLTKGGGSALAALPYCENITLSAENRYIFC